MSFAYIDSQGKEVSIPGPDALRLRIELGAITDSTRFYDEAEDRWSAASEHELYRQLKRDIAATATGDFATPQLGAPDPDVAPDADGSADLESPTDSEEEADQEAEQSLEDIGAALIDDFDWAAEPDTTSETPDESEPALDESEPTPDGLESVADESESVADEPADEPVAAAGEPSDEVSDGPAVDEPSEPYFASEMDADVFDQTISGLPSDDAEDDPTADELMWPEGATAEELDMGMDTFTIAGARASSELDGDDVGGGAGDDGETVDEPDDPGFDFGSMDLELEDEDEDEDEDEEDLDAAEGGFGGAGEAPSESAGGETTSPDESGQDETPDFGMVFDGGAPDDTFAADDEPDEGTDEGRGEAAAAASASAPDGTKEPGSTGGIDAPARPDPYERTIRERRGPRSRPPRRGGGPGVVRIAAGFLVVVAAGAAGAWFMTGSGEEVSEPVEAALPALPAELEPQFRELARNASSAMVAEFDSLPQRLTLSDQPGPRWLSGPYLSGASGFVEVQRYWENFDALLDEIIASEDDLWTAAWEDQLAEADLTAEVEGRFRDRGMAGWAAASPDREVVYQQLRGVIDASLDLHRFLVENESSITYDPSTGGGAGDPVLEVVPATPELGDEMWTGVGEITVALDALGYVQQVETEPLLDAVKARLVTAGIR